VVEIGNEEFNLMQPQSKLFRAFRVIVLLTLIALALEFILGVYTSLFIEFPDSLQNGNAWAWSMSHDPIVTTHVFLGTLLVVASLLAMGLSIALKNKTAITWTAAGLVMMIVAYLSGSIFLANIQVDAYSFSMALGFLGALITNGVGFYLTRPASQS
jgi:hypothetical protein